MSLPQPLRARRAQATVVVCLLACLSLATAAGCEAGPAPAPEPAAEPPAAPGEQAAAAAALVYDQPAGYCADTDADGLPYSPARPLWSDLDGPHYDGLVHTDGSQSVRYPDYRNVSHNLAVLQTLQFLLSTVSNLTNRIEGAQEFLEEAQYVDALYGAIPQVEGHCLCVNKTYSGGPCDPQTILADVEAAVTELLDVHGLTDLLRDFLQDKVEATVADLQDLVDWFAARIQPSGALVTALEQALYDTIDQELADAAAEMLAGPAAACDPGQIADYATALTAAVQTAVTDLRAELLADFQAVQDAVDLAISLPTSVLNQLRSDIETLLGWFDGVASFEDLVHVDWAGFIATVQGMVPYYQGVVSDVQAAIQDLSGVWDDVVNFDARVQQLADDLYQAVRDQLAAANADFADCVAAIEDALSYATTYDPQDFVDNLTAALRQVIEDEWDAARARVQQTLQALQERLTGVGLEDALSVFDTRLQAVRDVVTDAIAACYLRGTRPECFDFCEADAATAQDDFFWLPVDFLQDPQATAAGVLSGALFALEQTAWLDQVVEWVNTQMEGQLGTAFSTVLAVLSDFSSSIQAVIDWLTAFFGYVDRFTEGYHLGAYSELRPDLHMCIGYAGHGVYAQMGSLGADTFSIGARYSAHNLSKRQRVQFRSGGFAISAFGHDLSLAPTLELNVQMDGWKLWDQTRPFGIPLGATIDPDTVARLDVFNVVPMDDYPFGYGASVPVGATIVRDLFPSRPTATATAEWPRPGVAEPWEDRSVAVMSLGLNLHFEHGPIVKELPAIQVIPSILVAVPYFGISFGADWIHQTDLLRDRVQEMINANLPAADQLTADDFLRDMHAFQAPDLTADDGTAVFVEPELGVEAFLGFYIWKVKIGAGAKLGLAVNIRPGGYGGVVDLNAALADALLHSNPPVDAPCEPIWDVTGTLSCTNETFPESTGDYACEPADAEGSCCVTVVIEGGPALRRYAACLDAWTGIDATLCRRLDVSGTVDEVRARLDGLPPALDPLVNAIDAVLGAAQLVTLHSAWRATASCADEPCGGDGFPSIFSTAGLAVSALSECEQYGFCTYADGTIVHDTTLARCEEARGGFDQVDAGRRYGCALSGQGVNTCWPDPAAPTGPFAEVTAAGDWACGRSRAGAVECWGANNGSGQQDVPAGTYRDIDAGFEAACGVLDTAAVECWGDLAVVPVPAGPFAEVSVGDHHACGLRPTGEIACWGGYGAPAPFAGPGWTQVLALAGSTCALDGDGEALCLPPAASAPSCDLEALLSEPAGPFEALTAFGPCAVCGLGRDASVTCWGDLPGAVPPATERFLDFDGHVDGPYLCGVTPDRGISCWNGPDGPDAPPAGTFIGYTCRTETDATVAGWTGSGCHPLQQGFASACGCAEDDDCAAGETCDAEAGRCADSAGAPLSCVCDGAGACPAGRSCRDGACVTPCATDADCPPGRVCDGGSCVPPHGVPYAEEITWGMTNVTAPTHVINSYAMADILATLLLKIDIYVEASFKLFKKERKWTLFDWSKALDLGSTWKGWYQPGLEAFYQHECDNPALDEPVTNRYPRSLTSNPFDAIFEAAGVSDPTRHCSNGGVCRYRDPLPASETDPADYTTGNVGTVDEFLTWCKADLPQYVENPTPSTNDSLVDGIVDTAQWGEDITIELWERNQICIDGVVWDEWLASLAPTVAEDGTVLDPGALAGETCRYDDPQTGVSHTFPCTDVNAEMLRIWGCLRTDLNFFATLLAGEVPGYLTTDPDTGAAIFDVAAIFPGVAASDPVYGAGIDYSYTLDAMDPVVRFAYGPSPFTIPRLGELWLETVDACFAARFESLDETACECATDADCATDEGERCETGRCQSQQTYDDAGLCLAADCAPVWTWSECPIVYLFVAAGPCCGDGVVQAADSYTEECDDGPEGSATCSPTCERTDGQATGACCVPDGCIDAATGPHCDRRGGVWHAATTCAALDDCQPPPPTGACCLPGGGCLDAVTAPVCSERGGAWHEGGACSAAGLCPEPTGACCVPEGCLDAATASDCKGRNGVWHVGLTCDVPGVCPLPEPTGACCLADDSCVDAQTAKECESRKGTWHEARTCAERPCGPPRGACCRGLTCVDDIPEAKCGGAWHEGLTCEEIPPCRPPRVPVGACCVAGTCRDDLPALVCARADGTWSRGLTCAELDTCHPPVGACCLGRSCNDSLNLMECVERGGGWRMGTTCGADPDPCAPVIIKPPPGRDCVPGRLGCPIGGKG